MQVHRQIQKEVALGINCSIDPTTGTGTFSPVGNFSDCDKIIWDFIELEVGQMSFGNQQIQQLFTTEGEHTICMTVIRTQPNGKQCIEKFTKEFNVVLGENQGLHTFPNPASYLVNVSFIKLQDGSAHIKLVDLNHQVIAVWKEEMTNQNIQLDVQLVNKGLYFLVVDTGKEVMVEKLVIFR